MKKYTDRRTSKEEILAAIDGSIQKWTDIINREESDKGPRNCPLCQEFFYAYSKKGYGCFGCPVREKTGLMECAGTPYTDWDEYWDDTLFYKGNYDRYVNTENRHLAKAELEFLKELKVWYTHKRIG